LRSRLARICITQLSAGSSTVPGGYDACRSSDADGQFPVCDRRSPAEVAAELEGEGFELAWAVDPEVA
jgi:2-iminoacetate synthase